MSLRKIVVWELHFRLLESRSTIEMCQCSQIRSQTKLQEDLLLNWNYSLFVPAAKD